MNKPIIAIDIDDVLAASASAFIAFSNKRWGTHLTLDDFGEDWSKMWSITYDQTIARAREFHDSGLISSYNHYDEALPVLEMLHNRYRLVVLTSRNLRLDQETREWIGSRYPGLFEEIYFSGIYDNVDNDSKHRAYHKTKTDSLNAIGAAYLIDDQPKHVIGAAEAGIQAILFGNYSWNTGVTLPSCVERCISWHEVGVYFDALIR